MSTAISSCHHITALPSAAAHVAVTMGSSSLSARTTQLGANHVSGCERRDCGGNITWGYRQNILCSTPPFDLANCELGRGRGRWVSEWDDVKEEARSVRNGSGKCGLSNGVGQTLGGFKWAMFERGLGVDEIAM